MSKPVILAEDFNCIIDSGGRSGGPDSKLDTTPRFLMETDDRWVDKGTWKLNVKLLTKKHMEELKVDYTSRRSMKPIFEKVHRENAVICSLKEENGLVTTSQSDILRISKFFYARLYDTKPIDSVASQLFLSSITVVLDDSTWERLDQLLSLDELTKAHKLGSAGGILQYASGRYYVRIHEEKYDHPHLQVEGG
eukprot:g42521.t1